MALWNGGDRRSYYRFLRTVYGMEALSAWQRAKQSFAQYPAFMNSPADAVRAALAKAGEQP